MPSFRDVTVEASARAVVAEMGSSDVLVYSPTSLIQLAPGALPRRMISTHQFDRDLAALDLLGKRASFDKVVALGGGTAIDMGKYLAYVSGAPFTCIPAALSTNAFATDKVALYVDGRKVTKDACLPDRIVFDAELLASADPLLHRFGLADVASIHTALWDWRAAAADIKEHFDPSIFLRAAELLQDVRFSVKYIDLTKAKGLSQAMNLIGESGAITNDYGTGRPESGCEHILAKVLEHGRRLPHGVSISLGVVVGSLLQNNSPVVAAKLIGDIGTLRHPLAAQIGRRELVNALEDVRPRPDRYSVFDKVPLETARIEEVVDRVAELTGFGLQTPPSVNRNRLSFSIDA